LYKSNAKHIEIMKTNNLITSQIKMIAKSKSTLMPLGTYSRLKVNGEISDIVIQPSSSGIWFYNVPGTIGEEITKQIIGFVYYQDLK
jgi:hypothetical protein